MTNILENASQTSRRALLQTAATAAGALALVGLTAQSAKAEKVTQDVVAYQDSPNGAQSCGSCRLFAGPASCKQVDGVISSKGWCRIYSKAA
ncbi:MAG: high potential iron sulfur protein [Methylocella sp.]